MVCSTLLINSIRDLGTSNKIELCLQFVCGLKIAPHLITSRLGRPTGVRLLSLCKVFLDSGSFIKFTLTFEIIISYLNTEYSFYSKTSLSR